MSSTSPPPAPSPLDLLRELEVRAGRESVIPDTPLASSVVTLGNFDGLHIAHRALLNSLMSEARARRVPSVVISFYPHPAQFLRPESEVRLIMPIEERVRRIEALGVDLVIALRFDEAIAKMPAEAFVQNLLVGAFHPALLVIGPDTRFGRDRRGDAELLMKLGAQRGFGVQPLGTVTLNGQRVSSSGIRQCLERGDVETPRAWCETPFLVEGEIVHGAGRGGQIGFHTANVQTTWPTLPASGVYVVHCQVGENQYHGVANLGRRPTFELSGEVDETLEVHLLHDNVPDLYGEIMRVGFLHRLRDETRFSSSEALVAQIEKDISTALQLIEGERP